MRMLIILILGGAVGVALACRPTRRRVGRPIRSVRSAGTAEMRDPPVDWTQTYERSDESFPASDPPGTY